MVVFQLCSKSDRLKRQFMRYTTKQVQHWGKHASYIHDMQQHAGVQKPLTASLEDLLRLASIDIALRAAAASAMLFALACWSD